MHMLSNLPPFRFLITWRHCQSFPGCGSFGGAPRPPYSGTFPHVANIASGYAPFPTLDRAGGPSSGACIFTCSNSSGAISSSIFPIAQATRRRGCEANASHTQKDPFFSFSHYAPFYLYLLLNAREFLTALPSAI